MPQISTEVNAAAPEGSTPRPLDAPKKPDKVLEDASAFIALLEELAANDRGRIAALKRNVGENLPGRGAAWFPSLLRSGTARRNEEIFFLVATLFDLNRKPKVGNNLGSTLREAAARAGEAGIGRRFHLLLDASFDVMIDATNPDAPVQNGGGEMAFRLRQLVKLCASKDVGIDWPQLLADLCRWNLPDKRIQKKWARAYFGQRADAAPENDATENQTIEAVQKEI